jgi:hypothetical protein
MHLIILKKCGRASDYKTARKNAYIKALARERRKLVPLKQSDFISGSTGLPEKQAPWQ